MKQELKQARPIAEAFAKLLHPFAEVVIHDLEKDKIEAIYNPFSGRVVGDSSYLDRWDFTIDPNANVIGPYEKTNYDGKTLKSISIVLRNNAEKAVGFLCVNMALSVFETYKNTLQIFLSNNDSNLSAETQSIFKDDLYEQINIFIQNYCKKAALSLETLKRNHKKEIILALHQEGAFSGKNATSYIARILKISRASVYNYLNEERK